MKAAGCAAIFGMCLTSCTKEEGILPTQELDRTTTAEKTSEDIQARMGRKSIDDRRTGGQVYDTRGGLQLEFKEDGTRQDLGLGTPGGAVKTGRHEELDRTTGFDQEAIKLSAEEIIGQGRKLGSDSDRNGAVKTGRHDELDFTPAQSTYKETGAREK